MPLEDYLDAVDMKEALAVSPRAAMRSEWVEEYRYAAQAATLEGFA